MFKITRFVMEDFIDSVYQTIYIVSLSQRYMVYNASRRRLVYTEKQYMGVTETPLDLVKTDNLSVWTRTSRYRVSPEAEPRTSCYDLPRGC